MPKKRRPHYAQTKPTYVHPSLQRAESPTSSTAESSNETTVNQLIQQLRREQAGGTTLQRRDEVTDVVTQRTIPPHLRRILQLPEVEPLPPKQGTRSRTPRSGPRPPPGPAPPTSWLSGLHLSRHAPENLRHLNRHKTGDEQRSGRRGLSLLAKLYYDEFKRFPRPGSLTDMAVKSFVKNWQQLIFEEYYAVGELPAHLKEALLSYATMYGCRGCVDLDALRTLFSRSRLEGEYVEHADDICFFDFTGLLDANTLAYFHKFLLDPGISRPPNVAQVVTPLATTKGKEKAVMKVPDSWEDELNATTGGLASTTLRDPVFPNLTRVALGHPGPGASWTNLILVTERLKSLTHLSLAYWPFPGSPWRTDDVDVREFSKEEMDDAFTTLSRLARNTRGLKWLDLEGCNWIEALTWPQQSFSDTQHPLDWGMDRKYTPTNIYEEYWNQLEYVNLFAGWVPPSKAIIAQPAGHRQMVVLHWLRTQGQKEEHKHQVREYATAEEVQQWFRKEEAVQAVAKIIKYTAASKNRL